MASFPSSGQQPYGNVLHAHVQETAAFNITDYGAVADHTTNCTTAINNAITAANTAGGGTVILPLATDSWGIGSAIVMKSNVTLLLMGTVKALASHTGLGIDLTNCTNAAVTGPGTLDMNKAATSSGGAGLAAIYVKSTTTSSRVFVRDVTVKNCWQYGILASAYTGGSVLNNIRIEGTTVSTTTLAGILIDALGDTSTTPGLSISTDIRIIGNTVTAPGANGIQCKGVSDLKVERNIVTASSATGHGIVIGAGQSGVTTDQCTDFEVIGNRVRDFTSASKWGIVVSARCTRFDVRGNLSKGNTGGISVDLTDPNNSTSIIKADAVVAENRALSSTTSHGLNFSHATSLSITGNVSRGNANSGIAVSACTGLPITGNTTTENAVHGIGLFGTTPAGTGGHQVAGNYSLGNNTSAGSGHNYYTDATPVSSTLGSTATYATSTP